MSKGLTVGQLRDVLADLPDYYPVMFEVEGDYDGAGEVWADVTTVESTGVYYPVVLLQGD